MKLVRNSLSLINKRIWLSILLILGSLLPVFTQDIPDKPNPPHLVNDFAGMLSASEVDALETKLVAYNDSTSTQISIVIVSTLNGMEKAQYATELGEKWGIGKADKDNGILILVAKEERQVFIATGRGVEEYLPDIVCKRIVERKIVPNFKQSAYFDGLNAAIDEMYERLQGTFVGDDKKEPGAIPLWVIVLIIFTMLFILPRIFKNTGGGTYSRRGYSRGWGGGPFIGGGFGGGGGSSSGGGFGGFGGGSFGGGGSGGSW